jgi:hypothetical protein
MNNAAELDSMKDEDIVTASNKVSNYLKGLLREGRISLEVYEKVRSLNEEITKELLKGEDLDKKKPLNEIHVLWPARLNDWEYAQIIIKMIQESSHETKVEDFAHKIRIGYSKAMGYPHDHWSPSSFIYNVLRDNRVVDELDEDTILRIFSHYTGVAKAVEEKVRTIMHYVEEPDEIIRPATTILEKIEKDNIAYGDCDDFTVLIGSVWRALGFWVCIGIGPNHVFPAVILPSLEKTREPRDVEQGEASDKLEIIPTIIPGDDVKLDFFGKTFSCYDLLNFNSNIRREINSFLAQTKGSENQERVNNKLIRLYEFLKFNYYPIPPIDKYILDKCHHVVGLMVYGD